jgi:hypothetical protein
MSQQLIPVAVKDTVLDLDDKLAFAVFRSGQNISVQSYPANSQSSSQHVYAVQVPSTNTIVSRNLIWGSDITFVLTGTVQPYEYLVNLNAINQTNNGVSVSGADCINNFPLNQLCTNMSIQVNNTTVSSPVNQILDVLLRAIERKEFIQHNGTTPTQLDSYAQLTDALPQQLVKAAALAATVVQSPYIPTYNSPLNPYAFQANKDSDISRNSFQILSITGNTPAAAGAAPKTVTIVVRVREPIFVSPFLFGEELEQPGLAGITQINITANMDSTARRAWLWLLSPTAGSTKTVQSVSYANSYIECKYYTPKISDLIPATVVTPLAVYTNYQLPAQASLAASATGQSTSNSIMLNSYPDKVFVWIDDALKLASGAGTSVSPVGNQYLNHYATITSVVVTLNNQSGILSTFDATELFRASMQSGSKQSWAEFSGLQQNGTVAATGVANYVSTCGSVLMLDFSSQINVPQDYLCPGSLSTAQFQITVNYINNTNASITPQLNTMMMYSGILSTTNGSSSAYTSGVLTKSDVLSASARTDMNKHELVRYVGSGLGSTVKSIAASVLPTLKKALGAFDNNYAKAGVDALTKFGYGKKGGLGAKLY